MKLRIAAIFIFSITILFWYTEPFKTKDLAATCVSTTAPRAEIIAACTTLIEANETTPEYRHLFLTERAWAYSCDAGYDLAVADVNGALALQPENVKTRVLRARIHAAGGDHVAARADYDAAVEIAPEISYSHWNRARYLDKQGDRAAALPGYQRTLELNPNANNAAIEIIDIQLQNQEYDAALTSIRDAEKKWPGKKWVYQALTRVHVLHTADIEEALKAVEKINELEAKPEKFIYNKALIHLQIGDEATGIQLVNDLSRSQAAGLIAEEKIGKQSDFEQSNKFKENVLLGEFHAFEAMGRRELARRTFHKLLEEVDNGRQAELTNVLRRSAGEIVIFGKQDEPSTLNHLIDNYLDNEDFRPDWLTAEKS